MPPALPPGCVERVPQAKAAATGRSVRSRGRPAGRYLARVGQPETMPRPSSPATAHLALSQARQGRRAPPSPPHHLRSPLSPNLLELATCHLSLALLEARPRGALQAPPSVLFFFAVFARGQIGRAHV